MKRAGGVIFLLYLILGLYMINIGVGFFKLPEFISKIDNWIIFIGGLLLILGGINLLRLRRYTGYSSY